MRFLFRTLLKIYSRTAEYTAKKTKRTMKFSIADFFSKCDQIRIFLWIWSYLLKKSLMENFFCAVICVYKAEKNVRTFNTLMSGGDKKVTHT